MRRKVFGNEHPSLAIVLSEFGTALRVQGKFEQAEKAYRECLAIREKKVADPWYAFCTCSVLGETLLVQKKYDEAESLLRRAYEGSKQLEGTIHTENKNMIKKTLDLLTRLHNEIGRTNALWEN